ncbi:hypothetical protein Micbo1qcDRAFT_120082 [Microdochium bolleyi]|uniref:Modin n=1 Tax=Microdochium bolleyi TaxID=196109 RepID=A0A136J000_9PEZI|nr:hypothetical protein Micbo1qcDRAFT_120082 [Microdochium bolleyi]
MAGEEPSGEVIVGSVALLVACVALLPAVFQMLQAYFASATGFARCDPKVMGAWARSTRRVFRWSELRFEVQFETPVIFLAPPNNDRGPVPNEPIWYINGTEESRKETRSSLPDEYKKEDNLLSVKERIHTADNERASWVVLLAAIQQMEHDSHAWQQRFYKAMPGRRPPREFAEQTLAVAVQKKTKSWDTMPSTMAKPYATTTMCHLIELAAVLGVHWKEFNRSENKYRAEGNGFILTGSVVSELGLVFNFQKATRSLFESGRVIPSGTVKQFCFGVVPTVFCKPEDEKDDNLKYPFDVPQNLAAIKLGSPREVADTLTVVGCNTNTVDYFLMDNQRTAHLFPVTFEILGMLSRTLHGHGSGFRMLPNPTTQRWDKRSFSLWKLLEAYEDRLEQDEEITNSRQIQRIKKSLDSIGECRGPRPMQTELTVPLMETLHEALDATDSYLTGVPRKFYVFGVLRSHFQVILRHLNDSEERKKFEKLDGLGLERFEELGGPGLEDKQTSLMKIYFDAVRPDVVKQAPTRMPTMYQLPTGNVVMPVPSSDAASTMSTSTTGSDAEDGTTGPLSRQKSGFNTKDREDQLNDIWCTLVFRMICWLLLHDFHKEDVQIPKSELLGSRLPVYIV